MMMPSTFLVPYLKALHIAGLILWCAGLFALPIMLAWHDPAIGQADFRRIRNATHFRLCLCRDAGRRHRGDRGTWLVLLREVFVPWMYVKLLFVALLVAFHGWVGHILVAIAETPGRHRAPSPTVPLLILLAIPILAILVLVLGKPDLQIPMPDWLTEPRGNQLPFDVPSRSRRRACRHATRSPTTTIAEAPKAAAPRAERPPRSRRAGGPSSRPEARAAVTAMMKCVQAGARARMPRTNRSSAVPEKPASIPNRNPVPAAQSAARAQKGSPVHQ
jgi:protoporphyrinogen IX oxidase